MKTTNKKFILVLLLIISIGIFSAKNAEAYTFLNDLRLGSSGQAVVELQTQLIALGHRIPAIQNGAIAKGYFGGQTLAAVIKYQASLGLPPTGFVGPMTRGKLNGTLIIPPVHLKVVAPNGGEIWQIATVQKIKWTGQIVKSLGKVGVDISLAYYYPPCTGMSVCPSYYYQAPRLIAQNIDSSAGEYNWSVGSLVQPTNPLAGVVAPLMAGKYLLQVCETGTTLCDMSDAVVTITDKVDARTPVISSVTAPTSLVTGELGTWTVSATDPQNGALTYSVRWGDEVPVPPMIGVNLTVPTYYDYVKLQTNTFTHAYSSPGTYTVTLTVYNALGLETKSTHTVVVSQNSKKVNVVSPNNGERWVASSTQLISWLISGGNIPSEKVDIYVQRDLGCKPGFACIALYPTPIVLDKNIPADRLYYWIVATDEVNNPIPAGDYNMMICSAGSMDNCDLSDKPFTILR